MTFPLNPPSLPSDYAFQSVRAALLANYEKAAALAPPSLREEFRRALRPQDLDGVFVAMIMKARAYGGEKAVIMARYWVWKHLEKDGLSGRLYSQHVYPEAVYEALTRGIVTR
jgi:hypothetical protein